jgi:Skp family chaperone for outer membrane proteins
MSRALAGLIACLAVSLVAAAPPEKSLKIGVADITRISRAYAKGAEFQKTIDQLSRDLRAQEEVLSARIDQLDRDISALSMGNPQRTKLLSDYREKVEARANLRDTARRKMDDVIVESTRTIYDDISKEVEAYARAKGFDLILKQQSFDTQQPSAPDQSIRIGQRDVLYCKPEMDITNDIIEGLNKAYEAAKKAQEGKGDKERP